MINNIRTCDTAGQPQSSPHDKNVSQKVEDYPMSRVEAVNALYISTEVKSLDSLLQRNQVGHNVAIIPNPSYAITSENPPWTRETSEHEYDDVQTEKLNEHDKYGYLELTGSAPSCNKLTDPANDNINIDLNPSYSLSQGSQGVKLEDSPC